MENLSEGPPAPLYLKELAEKIRALLAESGAYGVFQDQVRAWATACSKDDPNEEVGIDGNPIREYHDAVRRLNTRNPAPPDLAFQFAIAAAVHDVVYELDSAVEPIDPWYRPLMQMLTSDERYQLMVEQLPYSWLRSEVIPHRNSPGLSPLAARQIEDFLPTLGQAISDQLAAEGNAAQSASLEPLPGYLGLHLDEERAVVARIVDGQRVEVRLTARNMYVLKLLISKKSRWASMAELREDDDRNQVEPGSVRATLSRIGRILEPLGVRIESQPNTGWRLALR